MRLTKPKSQADVVRNRLAIAKYIRELAQAARQIAAEEKQRSNFKK
jgi:hypothetical protein